MRASKRQGIAWVGVLRWLPIALVVVASSAVGCGPCLAGTAGNAAVNTAIAVGASAVRRADGDCYTPCDQGTVCNRETGYCDPLPCGHACDEGQWCDSSRPFPRCEAELELRPEVPPGDD